MSSLSDLISRWRDLREQGRSVSAEDLGGDCPELLSHPTRCLEAVAFMEDFLGLARDSASLFLPLNRAPATCLAHTPNPPTRRPEPVSSWGRFATCLGDEGRLQTCPTKGASSDARPGPEGYEILGELGRGAMGIVYKARQVGLNRLVALKMIRGLAQPDARQRARFRREAESVARLRHLNVVQVYEIGEFNERPFFAMEYVEDGSLARVTAGTPQPVRETARLVATLADAVQHAHEAGIIHRDLKPGNILLRRKSETPNPRSESGTEGSASDFGRPAGAGAPISDFEPKVTDFGLAKQLDDETAQTHAGQVMGTPPYMAPEQASGLAIAAGPWTDVWALGVILYELLTGRLPFNGEGVWDTLEQVRIQDPVPPRRLRPKVARDLETICLKCLRKDPSARYRSARELADDLRRFLDHQPILARPVGLIERVVKGARRRPALAALAIVLLVASLGAVGFTAWHYAELRRDRDEEKRRRIEADRVSAKGSLRAGEAAAQAKKWETAIRHFSDAVTRTAGEPELDDLRNEAERGRDKIGRARKQYDEFVQLSGKAWPDLPRVISRDTTVDREKTLRTGWKALAVFGVERDNRGGPVVDPQFFSEEDRERIAASCYELLLMLAVAEEPSPGSPTEAQLRRGLAVLDRAKSTGRTSRAYHLRRAHLLELLGQPADEERKAAKQLKASDAVDFFLEGESLFSERDFEQAARRFTRALDLRRDHFWAQYYRALCNYRLATEHPERAAQFWRAVEEGLTACIASRPDFVLSYVLRGYARGEMGDTEGAEKDFTAVEKLNPDPDIRYGLLVNRGTARGRRHDLKDAEKDLREAIALRPNLYQAHLNLARVYQENEKYQEARAEYDEALALAGQLPALYRLRARLLLDMKKNDEAMKDLDTAVRLAGRSHSRETAMDHLERAILLRRAGKLREAAKACEQAEIAFPTLAAPYRLHGEVLLLQERFADAVRFLTVYLELSKHDPSSPPPPASVYRARALALVRTGQLEEALADYTRALDREVDAVTLTERGWLYVGNEAPKLAEADFARAIKDDPKLGDAYNGRGFLRVVRHGEYEQGVADAELALKVGPETWRLVYNAARVYAQATVPLDRNRKLSWQQIEAVRSGYQGRAVELIRRALALQQPEQANAFWKGVVLKDSALNPIRSCPAFLRLVRDRGGAPKSSRVTSQATRNLLSITEANWSCLPL